MLRTLRSPVCATCRLRSLIKAKEIARSRRALPSTTTRAFASPSTRQFARTFATTSQKSAGFTQKQEVEFVERLYTSGNITRDEWRESVWIQAGLKRDAKGDIVKGGNDRLSTEDQVRRIHEWYSGDAVPKDLLKEEEGAVYERLFGGMREVVVSEGEGLGGMLGAGMGTNVLREGGDGELEEVEFDEEWEGEEEEEMEEQEMVSRKVNPNERLVEDIRAALGEGLLDESAKETANALDEGDEEDVQDFQRNHPLTVANRFATSPSTLSIPQHNFIDPVSSMLAGISNTHLSEAAHRIFGGPGLPYSTSTPNRGKTMQQKPIALDVYQDKMADIDGDAYISTIMPGVYSSVMSVLAETRKRMGTAWAEDLVRKAEAGELRILDAGGGGAGILAVREMLRAEWERMHEEDNVLDGPMELAEADGRTGGAGLTAPTGKATVLVGSDMLKKRVSKLLENTTFVPRLPDYVHTEEAAKKGKFDLIIAPHTLWPLREDYLRKMHVQNLWSLLSADSGILLLLEKGVARGFELIAGAREMLLETRFTPSSDIDEPTSESKDPGHIIAPCTNHSSCPMYTQKGLVKGRRDICAFAQRYHRPPFLANIFGTKGRNHEDVEFSYLSLLRGSPLPSHITQDAPTTDAAFQGYENTSSPPSSLSLPRSILPPLKKHGHIILDLCTPAGTLERWTVPKSFSKQAYRDAKKSSWGDLWALGAKTRVPRVPKIKKHSNNDADYADMVVRAKKSNRKKGDMSDVGLGSDEFGRIVLDGERVGVGENGRARTGKKIKGIRDKRDKKATGNGRKKSRDVD